MRIIVEFIPHEQQRYSTLGDWKFTKEGDLEVKVSTEGTPQEQFLVAIHEQVEAFLCGIRGISEESVTEFDMEFEKLRKIHPSVFGESEPGDMISAPYYKEHQFASHIEHEIADEVGVPYEMKYVQ